MGKKSTKRKTQWRTLSITEQDDIKTIATEHQEKQKHSDLCNGNDKNLNGLDADEVSSADDNYHYSGSNYSYLKRKSSSLSSSSYYNNNNNHNNISNSNNRNNRNINNNDYRFSFYKHNNNNFLTTQTTADTAITTNDPQFNQYNNNFNTYSHRYSNRRRPYSMQNGSNGSLKYYSNNYGSGRATSRANRLSYKYDETITAANKENTSKTIFNEEEYTRITTPRQDVIFKKGYFSKPKPYLSSTDTNTTSSATASVVSNEESMSATSGQSSSSPEQYSSTQSETMYDPEHSFMCTYVDQNGIIYVNPYMPNGFDQCPPGQMVMLPYTYPPYNYYSPDLSTPPLNDQDHTSLIEIKSNQIIENDCSSTNSIDENIKEIETDKVASSIDENVKEIETDKVENEKEIEKSTSIEVVSESAVVEDPTNNIKEIEPREATTTNTQYDKHIVNHYGPEFVNYGYGNQFYPPVFFPINMYNGQPMLPVMRPGYEASSEHMDEDSDDKDADSKNISVPEVDKSSIEITTDSSNENCAKDDSIENQKVSEKNLVVETDSNQNQNLTSEASKEILTDKIESNNVDDNTTSNAETDNNQVKFNANVEEFIPRLTVKPHLNVNVKEFLPRNYQSVSPITSENLISPNANVNESPMDECVKNSVNTTQVSKPATDLAIKKLVHINNDNNIKLQQKIETKPKLSLAEKIKQSLNMKAIKPETSVITSEKQNNTKTAGNSSLNSTNKLMEKKDRSVSKPKKSQRKLDFKPFALMPSSHLANPIIVKEEQPNSENVLSYAQILNKDNLKNDIPIKSTEQSTILNEPNEDIDVQILIKSLEAAEELTAKNKEQVSWQTVKPRGKRGKHFKENNNFTEQEEEMFESNDVDSLISPSNSNISEIEETEINVVEKEVDQTPSAEITVVVDKVSTDERTDEESKKITDKKKNRTRKKKTPKKLVKTSKSNISDKKEEDEDEDIDPDKLAKKLFEDLEQEIDLSLKIDNKEDDAEDVLSEIYSPTSSIIRKTFVRNPLEMRNGLDIKFHSGILREQEKMVLSVIKSLSSASPSASTNCSTQNNVFEESFAKNSTLNNASDSNQHEIDDKTDSNMVKKKSGQGEKENPENEDCAKYIENCIKESYEMIEKGEVIIEKEVKILDHQVEIVDDAVLNSNQNNEAAIDVNDNVSKFNETEKNLEKLIDENKIESELQLNDKIKKDNIDLKEETIRNNDSADDNMSQNSFLEPVEDEHKLPGNNKEINILVINEENNFEQNGIENDEAKNTEISNDQFQNTKSAINIVDQKLNPEVISLNSDKKCNGQMFEDEEANADSQMNDINVNCIQLFNGNNSNTNIKEFDKTLSELEFDDTDKIQLLNGHNLETESQIDSSIENIVVTKMNGHLVQNHVNTIVNFVDAQIEETPKIEIICNGNYSNKLNENNSFNFLLENIEKPTITELHHNGNIQRKDSSTSLEIQLRLLEEQLKKFEDIQTKPVESSDINNAFLDSTETVSLNNTDNKQTSANSGISNDFLASNICDSNVVQYNEPCDSSLSTPSSVSFPATKDNSIDNEKFPLTLAVQEWLKNEMKEKTPEPILRLPDDSYLNTMVRSNIENDSKNQYYYYDDVDEWSATDDDICENDNDETESNDNKKNNKILPKDSKNVKSNPLHVSSVNNHMDTDSDYNSDSQLRYDDDNTCERVALKGKSDQLFENSNQQQQQQQQKQSDLLDYWDDEFIENPKKWLTPNEIRYRKNNNDNILYNNNNNNSDSNGADADIISSSTSDELRPYKSLYGETIDYNKLKANNYQFLSNNIKNNNDKTFNKNDTSLLDNFDNNINHNNINSNNNNNNNNNNDNNCIKPPEVCCILM